MNPQDVATQQRMQGLATQIQTLNAAYTQQGQQLSVAQQRNLQLQNTQNLNQRTNQFHIFHSLSNYFSVNRKWN